MNIANGVTGVRIVGLTLVNGRAGDTDDASGGCMFMGEDTDVHLSNITFQNCSAPGMSMSGWERERVKGRERGGGGVVSMCFTLSERCILFGLGLNPKS